MMSFYIRFQSYLSLFDDVLRHGAGVHTWPDGRRYEGGFMAGVSHGKGESEEGCEGRKKEKRV
jgi:hypothetical protein